MANWFLGRALAEEAEAENAPWSFLGEGVTFWVTVAVLLVVGVAVYLVTRKKGSEKSFWTAKTMAVGAMCMALSSVLSLIKLWSMPMGGSVTPASMLPLLLFAYCYGVGPGMVLGALYGVMQFLLDGMAVGGEDAYVLARGAWMPFTGGCCGGIDAAQGLPKPKNAPARGGPVPVRLFSQAGWGRKPQ